LQPRPRRGRGERSDRAGRRSSVRVRAHAAAASRVYKCLRDGRRVDSLRAASLPHSCAAFANAAQALAFVPVAARPRRAAASAPIMPASIVSVSLRAGGCGVTRQNAFATGAGLTPIWGDNLIMLAIQRHRASVARAHHNFQFTKDWTAIHAGLWLRLLGHFSWQPGIQGMEIGCFEGRSSLFFLKKVLQHPTSSDVHRSKAPAGFLQQHSRSASEGPAYQAALAVGAAGQWLCPAFISIHLY